VSCSFTSGSFGGDGAIRIVSNSLTVSGNLAAAIVRLEAPTNSLSYSGTGTAPVLATINPLIFPTKPPSLTIVSIGGYPVPSYSGSRFDTIDLLLPSQLPDPISVVVQATNVPLNSSISIAFGNSSATSTTATLSGTQTLQTATLYVSGLSRTAVSYLYVSTTFSASLISTNLKKDNPERLATVEMRAAPGQAARYRFLRDDGSEIALANVPADIRHQLGL